MRVIKAKVLGFCMGVRRAIDLTGAEAQRAAKKNSQVFTIGKIIHNKRALDEITALGVRFEDELPANGANCSVVIRAHGISPAVETDLREKNYHIVDATCPNVKLSQLKAEEFIRAGYGLFIAGDVNHAEIIGIAGYAREAPLQEAREAPLKEAQISNQIFCEVVGNAKDAGKAAKKLYGLNHDIKTAIIAQTTISEADYYKISEAVRLFFPNLEIIQTICPATKERQSALRELFEKTDAVIIAGGKESANTQHLFSIAKESGKPCALAEDASQISEEFFKYETVGISAGASTPDSVVDEIEERLIKSHLS